MGKQEAAGQWGRSWAERNDMEGRVMFVARIYFVYTVASQHTIRETVGRKEDGVDMEKREKRENKRKKGRVRQGEIVMILVRKLYKHRI